MFKFLFSIFQSGLLAVAKQYGKLSVFGGLSFVSFLRLSLTTLLLTFFHVATALVTVSKNTLLLGLLSHSVYVLPATQSEDRRFREQESQTQNDKYHPVLQ